MVDVSRAGGRRRRTLLGALAVTCSSLALVAAGAPAAEAAGSPSVYHVEGHLSDRPDGTIGVDGDFVGTYRLLWQTESSAVPYGPTTLTTAEGVDGLLGCLDLDHDGRCGPHDAKGTITMAFRRISAYGTESHTLIESSCTRPVIGTTGRFAGGLLFMSDRATGPKGAIGSVYRGELVLSRP
jgi:hypothetical protein